MCKNYSQSQGVISKSVETAHQIASPKYRNNITCTVLADLHKDGRSQSSLVQSYNTYSIILKKLEESLECDPKIEHNFNS